MHRSATPVIFPLQPTYGEAPIIGQKNYEGNDLLEAALRSGWTYSPRVFARYIGKATFNFYPHHYLRMECTGEIPTDVHYLMITYSYLVIRENECVPNPFSKQAREKICIVGFGDEPDGYKRHGDVTSFFEKFEHDIRAVIRFEEEHKLDCFPMTLDKVQLENAINLYDEFFRVMTAHLVNEIWTVLTGVTDVSAEELKKYVVFYASSYATNVLEEVRARRAIRPHILPMALRFHEILLESVFQRHHSRRAFEEFYSCVKHEFGFSKAQLYEYDYVRRCMGVGGMVAKENFLQTIKTIFSELNTEDYRIAYLKKACSCLSLLAPWETDPPATKEAPLLIEALRAIFNLAITADNPEEYLKGVGLKHGLKRVAESYREGLVAELGREFSSNLVFLDLIKKIVWPESQGRLSGLYKGRKKRANAIGLPLAVPPMNDSPPLTAGSSPLTISSRSSSVSSLSSSVGEGEVDSIRLSTDSLSSGSSSVWLAAQFSERSDSSSSSFSSSRFSSAAAAATPASSPSSARRAPPISPHRGASAITFHKPPASNPASPRSQNSVSAAAARK
jgi:hypothetical protein